MCLINGRVLEKQDCGARFHYLGHEHSNACLYLSLARLDPTLDGATVERLEKLLAEFNDADSRIAAQSLLASVAGRIKALVAPVGNTVSQQRRHGVDSSRHVNFTARNAFASEEVCMAFAHRVGPLTVVSQSRSGEMSAVHYVNPTLLSPAPVQ